MKFSLSTLGCPDYSFEQIVELAKKYPGYALEKNKGYPSREHLDGIRRLGYTPEHRRSFHVKELEQCDLFGNG